MGERWDDQDLQQLRRLVTRFDVLLVAIGVTLIAVGSPAAGLGVAGIGVSAWVLATLTTR